MIVSKKLRTVHNELVKLYNSEFLCNLIRQATNVEGRYLPKKHHKLKVGDLVLLKEPLLKQINFPMARVTEVHLNDLDEVTDIIAFKGATRECVKRHVNSVIPLLGTDEYNIGGPQIEAEIEPTSAGINPQPHDESRIKRRAAVISQGRTQDLLNSGLV